MVVYAPATITLNKENVGTRYVMAAVRTLADPNDADDLKQVAGRPGTGLALSASQPPRRYFANQS
jgi:hypothetical protein